MSPSESLFFFHPGLCSPRFSPIHRPANVPTLWARSSYTALSLFLSVSCFRFVVFSVLWVVVFHDETPLISVAWNHPAALGLCSHGLTFPLSHMFCRIGWVAICFLSDALAWADLIQPQILNTCSCASWSMKCVDYIEYRLVVISYVISNFSQLHRTTLD